MQKQKYRMTILLAFAMYFLTGAACIVVGSSLSHLVKLYDMGVDKVVLLGSFYALGRVLTVYLSGRMVERYGPWKVLATGCLLMGVFLFGIPAVPRYCAGLFCAFLGGAGMGTQDTVCPVLLSRAFREGYAGAMSAGQAFFGLGNFTTPFLVGIMLSEKLPFYYSYYMLLAVPVIMLGCIPFAKKETGDVRSGGQNPKAGEGQQVKPLYTKRYGVAFAAVILGDVAYCAVVNGIGTYTASFAESLGISPSISAFMLTVYNVGCFVGSMIFVLILRKVEEKKVLLFNSIAGVAAILCMLLVDQVPVYFVCLAVAGVFLGVLFSVYVTIATRMDYQHVSRAASLIGTAGGGSDILTPVVTGAVVSVAGVKATYTYVIIMGVISILAEVVLYRNTSENGKGIECQSRVKKF